MSVTPSPRPSPVRPSPVSPAVQKAPAAPTVRLEIKPRERKERALILLLNAVEGWAKTTIAAHAESPMILMSGNETGYDTLLSRGLVPSVPAEIVESWPVALQWVRQLAVDPQGIKTLAVDALGGFEALCRNFVCERDFAGDWSDNGFNSFGKGADAVSREWAILMSAFEQLRDKQGVTVLMLGHVKIELFNNPTGTSYNRYASDLTPKVWGITAKVCDAVLFGTFYQAVDTTASEAKKNSATRKGKVVGEAQRVIVTEKRNGFDAKNRLGLDGEIWFNCEASEMYATLWAHINGKKE